MAGYTYSKNKLGVHILNVMAIYEKICIAARIIAAVPDSNNIIVYKIT